MYIYIYFQSFIDNIGTKTSMSQCADHGTTFPDHRQ